MLCAGIGHLQRCLRLIAECLEPCFVKPAIVVDLREAVGLSENTPGFMLSPQTIIKGHTLDREVGHLWFEVVIALNAGDFFQNING